MEVTYQNNLWDVIQANVFIVPRSKTYIFLWVLVMGFFGYLAFDVANSQEYDTIVGKVAAFLFTLVFSFGTFLVLMTVLLSIYLAFKYFFFTKDHSPDCTLTAGEAGVKVASSFSQSEIKWAGIQKIKKTRNHIYIFLSDTSAIVVPQNAFAGRPEMDQFYDYIIGLWNSDKSKIPG